MRILRKAGKFARKRERKGLWRGVVMGIAAVVVFCTTYALILPAITMETEGFSCGMAEHSHTEECYQLICGQQEYFSHSHADTCYEGGQLVCGLTERVCHHHTDACYSQPQPVCGVEELPAHSHGEACYETHSILTCGVEEHPAHSHGEECYVEGELTCTLAETPGHTHGEECYQQEQTLICGKEETPGHSHTQDCYPADFEPELICGQEDIPEHRHSEACYSRICEKEEHAHTELCVDSHEAFLENQNEILNDVTEPSKADEDTLDNDGTDTSDTPDGMDDEEAGLTILWNDPQAAEEAGYALVCTVDEAEHVHDEECYVPAGAMSQILQGMQYAMAPLTEGGVMPLAEGDTGVLPVGDISAVNTKYDSKTDSFATSVTITFTFPGVEGQKAVSAGTTYTYTYLAGTIIPVDLLNTEQTLLDKSGHPAGTYKFIQNADGTYSVQAVFSPDYVKNNVGTGTDHPVEGYIDYRYEFLGSQLKGDELQFGDNGYLLPISGKITYPDDSTESYNIDVSKEGSWVQDGDKLVYTVYVRTTKGTPDSIAFSDIMMIPEGLTIGEPTVQIEKGQSTYYKDWQGLWSEISVGSWTDVTSGSQSYSDGSLSISLGGLNASETTDGSGTACVYADTYRITYTYPISDQTQASVSPNNSVSVSATDSGKGQTVKDSAEKTVTVSKDFSYTVDKSGAIASDKPGYIKWTVTVNSNKQDLVEAKLTDDMLGMADAEGVTIEPSTGAQVNRDGNSKITDITFTEYENGVNKNTYIITYYTPVTETWDGTTVNNKATLDPDPYTPGDEKDATATVTVNGVQFDKTGSHNAETDKLDWVITVNSGNLDIAGATLTDAMFAALNENAFTIQPQTGCSFTRDGDNKITGITFYAVTDGKNTQSYTITYSTDIPTDEESGSPVTSVTNTATLSPGEGKPGTQIPATSTVTLEEAKLSKKGDYDWGKDGINWTVTVNENHKNIATAEFTDSMLGQLTPSDIVIKDGGWNVISADSGVYTINPDANGKVTSIVFNQIGDTGVNTNQYIITYFTSAPQEWKDKTVHNEAKLTLDGKDIIVPADVTVPGSGDIAKSAGGGTVSEDGRTITIPWTVTLTVPKGGLPINTLVIDDVTKKDEWTTNTNQWITTEQANALIAAGMTWTDDDGNVKETVVLSDGQVAWTGDVDHYTGFTITFQDSLTPPEGATKLTFTYNTTADLTQTTIGQNVFYNFVSVGEKTKGAEYIHYKPGVVKTDGNWQTEDTVVSSSGSVTWKVSAKVGMGNTQLTLIDTLPEGVTLDSLHLSGWSNLDVTLTVAEDGTISGTDTTNRCNISGTYSGQKITLNIKPQAENQTLIDGEEFVLTVNCRVTDGKNATGSKTLTNNVTMELNGEDIGSASQTQNWTYQEDAQDVVSKNGKWDNNARLLTYTLVINPEGADLDAESGSLELKDVLKYKKRLGVNISVEPWWVNVDVNISLNPGSVTLKNIATGETVTDWLWTYSTAAENEWSQVNTLTVTIPDSTPLQLEYSYSVSSNAKEGYTFELDVSNTATLQTQYYDEDRLESGKTWSNQTTSGGVTSSSSLLTLTKVNAANNGEYLPGAEFTVYAYRQSTVDGGTPASWEYELEYTTDDKGAITISQGDASKGEHVFDTDVLFKVVETKAPSGYLLPDSPPEYYFYFSGSGSSSMALPDGVALTSATDLNTIGNSILVKNNKIPTTEIEVNKQWFNSTGTDITADKSGSVQFDLFWLPKTTQPGSGGGSGASGISYQTIGNGTVSTQNISYDSTIQVGSKVRITISMTYRISWGDPTVSITGVSLTSGGWNHDANLSVGTFEGTVTDKSIIVQLDYPVNEFSVEVTNLSDPVSSSSGSTPPTGGTKYNEQPYLITADSGWTTTINNLPVSYTDGEGNTVYYAYYVQETTTGYSVSYENNGGIGSGTIVIQNSQSDTPTYQLPATGGLGTVPYTMAGLLLIVTAGIPLLYSQTKRKKGERR